MEEVDVVSGDQFEGLVKISDECYYVTPVCDQSFDDVPILVKSEIQPIFANALAYDFVMSPKIVVPVYILSK